MAKHKTQKLLDMIDRISCSRFKGTENEGIITRHDVQEILKRLGFSKLRPTMYDPDAISQPDMEIFTHTNLPHATKVTLHKGSTVSYGDLECLRRAIIELRQRSPAHFTRLEAIVEPSGDTTSWSVRSTASSTVVASK